MSFAAQGGESPASFRLVGGAIAAPMKAAGTGLRVCQWRLL